MLNEKKKKLLVLLSIFLIATIAIGMMETVNASVKYEDTTQKDIVKDDSVEVKYKKASTVKFKADCINGGHKTTWTKTFSRKAFDKIVTRNGKTYNRYVDIYRYRMNPCFHKSHFDTAAKARANKNGKLYETYSTSLGGQAKKYSYQEVKTPKNTASFDAYHIQYHKHTHNYGAGCASVEGGKCPNAWKTQIIVFVKGKSSELKRYSYGRLKLDKTVISKRLKYSTLTERGSDNFGIGAIKSGTNSLNGKTLNFEAYNKHQKKWVSLGTKKIKSNDYTHKNGYY